MGISNLNAASAYGAAHAAQMNSAAANAFLMPAIPPGNTFTECAYLVFSDSFKKYTNMTGDTPPLIVVRNVNDYLSSCVCKVYNETFPSLKDSPIIAKNTPSIPNEPKSINWINSISQTPPIIQNISNYFFKVFVPNAENTPRDPNAVAREKHFLIVHHKQLADTLISMNLKHYYAQKTTPAINILDASIYCSANYVGRAAADERVVDLVKELCSKYFKNMSAIVYVNNKRI